MTLKQKTFIVTVVGLATILFSGFAQFWSMSQIDSAWSRYTTQAETRQQFLGDIKEQFGYGGIIHNFKNFVLRGQKKHLGLITQKSNTINETIKQYKELPLSKEEKEALNVIESVAQQYTSQALIIKNKWQQQSSPKDIDNVVKINDAPAFAAFKVLDEHLSAISTTAHQDMDFARKLQFVFLLASFGLLVIVVVAAVLIQRTQTATIVTLADTMADIEKNQSFSRRIHEGRTDEVGTLTATFDKLLGNIESILALNRTVLDAIPDPIYLSKNGKVISGNMMAASYAGIHIKDLRGLDDSKVLIRTENQDQTGEYITCIKDNEHVVLDEIIKDVTDRDGNTLGRLVVARDVTLIIQREAEAKANLTMMREVGGEITRAAQELVSSTESFTGRIQTISEGAQTQQERSSETEIAIGQMNDSVMDVARNASGAAELAEQARSKAVEGADVVEKSINAISSVSQRADTLKQSMGKLGDHTQSIGAIIGVINDIADQTNLLALNAAIEAARAGEAGRGFAVVADEVRKLAEKTMTATKDVAEAIESIQSVANQNIQGMDHAVDAVNEATDLAGLSGEALKSIVDLVEGTTGQVQSIAAASEQQSASSEEITTAISTVHTISNQTAEGMRKLEKAVKALADLAQRLDALATKAN